MSVQDTSTFKTLKLLGMTGTWLKSLAVSSVHKHPELDTLEAQGGVPVVGIINSSFAAIVVKFPSEAIVLSSSFEDIAWGCLHELPVDEAFMGVPFEKFNKLQSMEDLMSTKMPMKEPEETMASTKDIANELKDPFLSSGKERLHLVAAALNRIDVILYNMQGTSAFTQTLKNLSLTGGEFDKLRSVLKKVSQGYDFAAGL